MLDFDGREKAEEVNKPPISHEKNGYLINDMAKIIILPEYGYNRSIQREREIKKFGYDLQNNLF